MKILASGANGVIGAALIPSLQTAGHEVVRMVRATKSQNQSKPIPHIVWNPEAGRIDRKDLEGIDAIINLGGEPIAQRWTAEKKTKIRNCRVDGTRAIAAAIAAMDRPPQVWINASAIGYYGDRGSELLTERSTAGAGFLAEVCEEWEAATGPASQRGVRVVLLRTGMVLSRSGGALEKMLLPFQLGLGGQLGSGRQYMSWIAIEDQVSIIHHIIENSSLSGPVNAVAPNPATNIEFTRTLGRGLKRPTLFPVPSFAVKFAFGEMGKAALLSSARVEPQRLLETGFRFQYPSLEGALRQVLNKFPEEKQADVLVRNNVRAPAGPRDV